MILNTGLFTGRVRKGFMAWRNFAERNPDLPVGFVIQGGTTTELPDDVVAAYEAPFPTPESKAGAAQFPLLVPMSEDEPMVAQQRAMAEELATLGQAGAGGVLRQDPVFPFPKRRRGASST